ncbi:hypothetical protein DL89DRAFT_107770 [Linderina pennispora]|uniref:Uncharacterized protein n=1 Tax=Linderina pennispora TaxID=61395 RepID=A0A1Y1WEX0_9FUNG|nr:uncharacterized protein DL89DRAFT_107770 [Linderina pennispora]ORX72079.1 hypothetical protein DL89DRAFT_107770 [Linderina pennispora]
MALYLTMQLLLLPLPPSPMIRSFQQTRLPPLQLLCQPRNRQQRRARWSKTSKGTGLKRPVSTRVTGAGTCTSVVGSEPAAAVAADAAAMPDADADATVLSAVVATSEASDSDAAAADSAADADAVAAAPDAAAVAAALMLLLLLPILLILLAVGAPVELVPERGQLVRLVNLQMLMTFPLSQSSTVRVLLLLVWLPWSLPPMEFLALAPASTTTRTSGMRPIVYAY